MQEEQDTCRICSAPAEPDQPLFYPCKCSGTIRYIHQDCLTTWLAHSKKKTCDVCKYPYTFTKVYSSDMPARLPITLIIRRLIQQAVLGILFAFRGILVGTVWLGLLPYATVWTWRMYFAMGDATAWWISDRPRPIDDGLTSNISSARLEEPEGAPRSRNATLLTSILLHPTVASVSSDIVAGQIIASVIVLGFVAVFLLREWISQNARPGVFDDAELPPEAEPLQVDFQVNPVNVQIQPVQQQPAVVENPPPVPLPEIQPRAEPQQQNVLLPRFADTDTQNIVGPVQPQPPPAGEDIALVDDRRKVKRRLESPERDTHLRARSLPRRLPSSDGERSDQVKPLDLQPEQQKFTFTFQYPPPSEQDRKLKQKQRDAEIPSNLNIRSGKRLIAADSAHDTEPTDLDNGFPKPSDPSEVAGSSKSAYFYAQHQQTPPTRRRPPMPNVSLPSSALASPSLANVPGPAKSRGDTPLASPSLATYSAPEEFEAGPSRLGYFASRQTTDSVPIETTESEYARYFREPDSEAQAQAGPSTRTEIKQEDEQPDMMGDSDTSQASIVVVPPWSDDEEEDEEENEDHENAAPFDDAPPDENEERAPVGDQLGVANGGEAALQGANGGIRVEFEQVDQEEMDANIEDDMDGALEAIGLRGPIYGVIQNAAFMTFVLDATIGILVWLPFTIGKTIALLSLDPARLLEVIHSPLRTIRLITDPIVDLVSWVLAQAVFLPMVHTLQRLFFLALQSLDTSFGGQGEKVVDSTPSLINRALGLVNLAVDKGRTLFALAPDSNVAATVAPSLLERLAENDHPLFRMAEPYFAPVGEVVREQYHNFKETWVRLATTDTTSSRIFAIYLGYAVDILIMAIYLNVLTFGNVRSAGRAVRNAIRQQLLVVKVAIFIIVELVIFPLGCGIMLDACSVWLLPHGSLRSRIAFLTFAPVTAAFYHWVIGTMFMYQFAVLLAGCRSIMRPGSMWFIKDPQDQNFHPIRDILERPTFVQIKKLLLSAVMYGIVVAFSTATFSGILRVFSRTIMPFRWKILEPLSEVPIDLLFFHLVLPYTLHYFRPRKALYKAAVKLWKFLAHQLRLSSYMFGIRDPVEEFTPKHWSLKRLFVKPDVVVLQEDEHFDGTFWRVPNHDNVAQVRNERAIVEVDSNGQPKDAEGRRLIALLDAEATKAKRDIKTDYAVVYIPPNFRQRIMLFILCLWVIGAVFLAAALALPILIGRSFFEIFTSRPVHDGYSFIAGFYLLWGAWLFIVAIDRMDRRRQRRGGDEPRARLPLYLVKRGFLWATKVAYLAFFLGVVLPTLLALVVELYVVLPIRYAYNPDMQLRIRIVDMWALGLLYAKIALRTYRPQGDAPIYRGIETIKRNGWAHPDPLRATREVIVPICRIMSTIILAPPLIMWPIFKLLRVPLAGNLLFLHVYPGLFSIAGFARGLYALSKLMGTWSQSIRDKEFLVEMRLQNLEEPQPEKPERKMNSQGTQTEKM